MMHINHTTRCTNHPTIKVTELKEELEARGEGISGNKA